MDKPRMPHTRTQKGKGWATLTLIACGAFSLWANVRSGMLSRDSIVVSVLPPVVAFLTTKLIAYLSPKTKWTKTLVYGGFGLITLVAMYGSGFHIVEFVMKTGQPWLTAISYVFIADAPMLLAAAVLVAKVPMQVSQAKPATETKPTPTPKPVKAAPAKTVAPKATNAPQKAVPAKRTSRATKAQPAFSNKAEEISMDEFEQNMLTA